MGIYLSDQERDCLTNLRFADDLMLFATSRSTDTEHDVRIQRCNRERLRIHPDKTKILSNESSMNSDKKDTLKSVI